MTFKLSKLMTKYEHKEFIIGLILWMVCSDILLIDIIDKLPGEINRSVWPAFLLTALTAAFIYFFIRFQELSNIDTEQGE